jgi:hypothetical protein
MSIKHRTGSKGVLAALKLTGMAAMVLSFIMMAVLAGCPTEDDSSSGGGGGKPTTLASDATESQARTTLDAIIAYSGTPAATKTQAEALKSGWSAYSSNWSTMGSTAIQAINALIATIN